MFFCFMLPFLLTFSCNRMLRDFFFGATACFPWMNFFLGIVTYPSVISNGPPLKKGLVSESPTMVSS